MFTGLVEEIGACQWMRRSASGIQLSLNADRITKSVRTGDSISVNGCCLTVSSHRKENLVFDLLEETLRRTNLGALRSGDPVNLERALAADGRLGGHFVQGHIDEAIDVLAVSESGPDLRLDFFLPETISPYVAFKGSVAINGVSLTVAEIAMGRFTVWIIPHTRAATNLGKLLAGDRVNLETDILAKYAERILTGNRQAQLPS
jgi:riboflavin synthase